MEDSTWEGWTQPLPPQTPPGMMDYPTGRKLTGAPPSGWVGQVWSLPRATPDAVRYAARTWPQLPAEGFDRRGREFTERSSGIVYRLVHGNPLLGDGGTDVADLFAVEDDVIWFLVRVDRPLVKSVSVGTVGGMRAT